VTIVIGKNLRSSRIPSNSRRYMPDYMALGSGEIACPLSSDLTDDGDEEIVDSAVSGWWLVFTNRLCIGLYGKVC
jgi:hypothetical protein